MIEEDYISVVVIDDEPHVLEGLESLIPWDAYRVTSIDFFSDAVEAYHYIKHKAVDLIITDVRMPEMSGIDLIEGIKEINPAIEIIVMSGYKEFDYVKQVMALGARSYLVKSIFQEDLLEVLVPTIDEILKRRSMDHYGQAYDDALLNRYIDDEKQLSSSQYTVLQSSFLKKYRDSGAQVVGLWFDENDHDVLYEQLIDITPTMSWLHEDTMVYIVLLSDKEAKEVMGIVEAFPSLKCNQLGPITSLKALKTSYKKFKSQLQLMHHYRKNRTFFIEDFPEESTSKKSIKSFVSKSAEAIHLGAEEEVFEIFTRLIEWLDQSNLVLESYRKQLIIFFSELVTELESVTDQVDYRLDILPEKVTDLGLESLISFIETKLYKMIESAQISREQHKDEFKCMVEAYIHKRIRTQITIKDMAEALHMHPNYMGKKLKNVLGESFSLYLNRLRINMAIELLEKNAQLSIEEAAYNVGYASYPLFLKYFKMFNELTPKVYIQSLKNK